MARLINAISSLFGSGDKVPHSEPQGDASPVLGEQIVTENSSQASHPTIPLPYIPKETLEKEKDASEADSVLPSPENPVSENEGVGEMVACPIPVAIRPTSSEASFLVEPDERKKDLRPEDEVAEVISSGVQEFQNEFLGRVDEAFQIQVTKITTAFAEKLSKTFQSMEESHRTQLETIKNAYRNRLLEFEDTTVYYNHATEAIVQEHKERLEKSEVQLAIFREELVRFEEDLKRGLEIKFQEAAAAIKERAEGLKRNYGEEFQEQVNIANSHRWLLEKEFKKELSSLEVELEKIKAENEELEEKLEYGRISILAAFDKAHGAEYLKKQEYNDTATMLKTLGKELSTLEAQKQEIIETQQHNITYLILSNKARAERHNSEIEYFKEKLKEAGEQFKEEMGHLEKNLEIQRTLHAAELDGLKTSYREQVANLVNSVTAIREYEARKTASNRSYRRLQTISKSTGALGARLSELRTAVTNDPTFSLAGNKRSLTNQNFRRV